MKIAAKERTRIIQEIGHLEINYCDECPVMTQVKADNFTRCHKECEIGKHLFKLGKELLGGETFRQREGTMKAKKVNEELLVELYKQGKSGKEIGKIVGIDYSTVYRRLKRLGVQRNSRQVLRS